MKSMNQATHSMYWHWFEPCRDARAPWQNVVDELTAYNEEEARTS
jgi:hypothetical protein